MSPLQCSNMHSQLSHIVSLLVYTAISAGEIGGPLGLSEKLPLYKRFQWVAETVIVQRCLGHTAAVIPVSYLNL